MVKSLFPIALDEAVVSKKGKVLVGPVSQTISAGGPTVIIGPNGSGKTTLLRLIHGLERARKGSVSFALSDEADVHARQSFVFQKPIMLRRSTLENVMYPLIVRGVKKAEARDKAKDMLARIGLLDSIDTRATFLSGGEAQKLAIGRGLITKPELLILDEPTASLDSQSIRDIEALILEALESGVEILMTTHDMGQARRLANKIIFLNQGKIGETTLAEKFWDAPKSEEAARFVRGDIV